MKHIPILSRFALLLLRRDSFYYNFNWISWKWKLIIETPFSAHFHALLILLFSIISVPFLECLCVCVSFLLWYTITDTGTGWWLLLLFCRHLICVHFIDDSFTINACIYKCSGVAKEVSRYKTMWAFFQVWILFHFSYILLLCVCVFFIFSSSIQTHHLPTDLLFNLDTIRIPFAVQNFSSTRDTFRVFFVFFAFFL